MSRLQTVRTFYDLPAAEVARSALLGHGIPSHLLDAHLAGNAWHYTFALGGIRLAVLEDHAELARQVLDLPTESDADSDPIDVCPDCGTDDVFRPGSLVAGALGFLISAIPFPVVLRRRSCRACGAGWHKAA